MSVTRCNNTGAKILIKTKCFAEAPCRYIGKLLRCEWYNDLLKPWVSSQFIPIRMQTEQTIIDVAGNSRDTFQFFDREILVAGPTVDDGEILNQQWAVDSIFLDWDKLDGSFTMLDGLVSLPKRSFDHSESAKCFAEVRLIADDVFAFGKRGQKKAPRSDSVATLPS